MYLLQVRSFFCFFFPSSFFKPPSREQAFHLPSVRYLTDRKNPSKSNVGRCLSVSEETPPPSHYRSPHSRLFAAANAQTHKMPPNKGGTSSLYRISNQSLTLCTEPAGVTVLACDSYLGTSWLGNTTHVRAQRRVVQSIVSQ
jgi:hypothetical protein